MRIILGSLSFLCCLVGFVRRRRVSLFFFLLLFRRWGNTSRAAVCGSPCVVPATLLVFDPFTFVYRYIKAYRPHLLFFFCFVVSPLVVGLVCLGGGGPLSLSLSLSLSAVRLAMHVCVIPRERGGGLPDGAPSYDHNCLGFFREMSMGQCPGRSVQNCPCSPHFLPQPSKTEAGRGSGGATVLSDKCFCATGGPYCHANDWCSSPLTKGEMLLVFSFVFFVVWFLSFAVFWQSSLLLRVGLRNIFGSELLFLLSFWFLVFLVWICLWFFEYFFAISPRKCLKKILLMSGLVFCLVLSVLGFGLTT